MDTRLKEEFLTCIVCQEVFRDPVTLHCGHTFCIQCVTAFTKTQEEAKEKESIPCPHCRGLTKVPDPQRQVEEWAGQIKTGFFVKGLVETFLAKDTGDHEHCTSCKDEGKTTTATVWCPNCEKSLCSECERFHKKFAPSHKVRDMVAICEDIKEKTSRVCQEHLDTVVDMFCQTCDVAACSRCCLTDHKSCVESIVKLSDAMPKITATLEERSKELTSDMEDLRRHVQKRKTQITNMESNDEMIEARIEEFGDRVARLVKRHLKTKFHPVKTDALQCLKDDVKSSEEQLQIVTQTYGLIANVMESPSHIDRFDMYKVLIGRQRKTKEVDSIVTEIDIFDNIDTISSNINSLQLGDIRQVYDPTRTIEHSTKATLIEKIDTKIIIEDTNHDIFDIMVLDVGGTKAVVVTAPETSRLKSFYSKGGMVRKSVLTVNPKPRMLMRYSINKGAVAMRESKEICIFRIVPDLEILTIISTSHAYVGLAALSGKVFAASWVSDNVTKTGIDLVDDTGSIKTTILSNEFKRPSFITAGSGGNILVSDRFANTVMSVTDKGAISTHTSLSKDLMLPRGIVKTKLGECFVVDRSSNRVLYFNENGDTWKAVLTADDGIDRPCGLCVDDHNHMYVSVADRYVYVYSFAA